MRIVDKETQPPSRLSQGKLVEMMEERGLGTKATRADIIQKLFDRGYVYGNPPIPSETGIAMYEAFSNYVPEMATPEMTAKLEAEMDQIGDLIARVLAAPDDDRTAATVKEEVERLCRRFPLYPELQTRRQGS